MIRSLDIGATGMLAQQLNVDTISNNIANMTTTGFKRQRAAFRDLMYQNIDRPGTASSSSNTLLPTGLQLGLGVQTGAIYRIHAQGTMNITENTLDVAIRGDGFFPIEMPNGNTAYTRDGTFQLNEDGDLVTLQGYRLASNITIPDDATSIDINENGEVLISLPGQTTTSNAGQIDLATFTNPAGLEAIGNNLLRETDASGAAITGEAGTENFGSLLQGALEQSNVNVVEEMTQLISAQRAYEMNSNIISTSDEMLRTVSQLR